MNTTLHTLQTPICLLLLLSAIACGSDENQDNAPWKNVSEMVDGGEENKPDLGTSDLKDQSSAPDLATPDLDAIQDQFPKLGSIQFASQFRGCDRPSCSKDFRFGIQLGVMSRYQQGVFVRRYNLDEQDAEELKALISDSFVDVMQSKEGWACDGAELTESDERVTVMLRVNMTPIESDSFLHDVSKCYKNNPPKRLEAFFDFSQRMSMKYNL